MTMQKMTFERVRTYYDWEPIVAPARSRFKATSMDDAMITVGTGTTGAMVGVVMERIVQRRNRQCKITVQSKSGRIKQQEIITQIGA